MEIQNLKDGDILLMKLQSNIWLEHLKQAVLYREKMRRNLIWNLRRLG